MRLFFTVQNKSQNWHSSESSSALRPDFQNGSDLRLAFQILTKQNVSGCGSKNLYFPSSYLGREVPVGGYGHNTLECKDYFAYTMGGWQWRLGRFGLGLRKWMFIFEYIWVWMLWETALTYTKMYHEKCTAITCQLNKNWIFFLTNMSSFNRVLTLNLSHFNSSVLLDDRHWLSWCFVKEELAFLQ